MFKYRSKDVDMCSKNVFEYLKAGTENMLNKVFISLLLLELITDM